MENKQKQKFNLDLPEIMVSLTVVLSVASSLLFVGGIRPANALAAAIQVNSSKVDSFNIIHDNATADIGLVDLKNFDEFSCQLDRGSIDTQSQKLISRQEYLVQVRDKINIDIEDLEDLAYTNDFLELRLEINNYLDLDSSLMEKKIDLNNFLIDYLDAKSIFCSSGRVSPQLVSNLVEFIGKNNDMFGFSDEYLEQINSNYELIFNVESSTILFGVEFYDIVSELEYSKLRVEEIITKLNKQESDKYSSDFRVNKKIIFLD